MSVDIIYGIVKNVTKYLNGKDIDVFVKKGWGRIDERVLPLYKKINNEIENHYYDYDDLVLYILYKSLWTPSFQYKMSIWDYKEIDKIKKILTTEQLKKDRKIFLEIAQKVGNGDLKTYFNINTNGRVIVFDLMFSQTTISPMFVIKYLSFMPDVDDEPVDIKRTKRILYGIQKQISTKNNKKTKEKQHA